MHMSFQLQLLLLFCCLIRSQSRPPDGMSSRLNVHVSYIYDGREEIYYLIYRSRVLVRTDLLHSPLLNLLLLLQIPYSLFKNGSYDHLFAGFGIPSFGGGSIAQFVYYAASDLCNATVDTRAGYPEREKDKDHKMKPWQSPYMLLVDRGNCTFATKVRHAQMAGASAVVVADTTCLCSDAKCVAANNGPCEATVPIVADDGSASDISIPSSFMFKLDADALKDQLIHQGPALMELSWGLPKQDDRIPYDVWTSPTDPFTEGFFKNFKEIAKVLGDRAYFTPHMYISNGTRSFCFDAESRCLDMCTNNGRYCAASVVDELGNVIPGRSIVEESLRRLCIWHHTGENDGIGTVWWDYVGAFAANCRLAKDFSSKDCILRAYKASQVNPRLVDQCIKDTGGTEENHFNAILDYQLVDQTLHGIVAVPTVIIDDRSVIQGPLTARNVLAAICASYNPNDTLPFVCQRCGATNTDGSADVMECHPFDTTENEKPSSWWHFDSKACVFLVVSIFGGMCIGVLIGKAKWLSNSALPVGYAPLQD